MFLKAYIQGEVFWVSLGGECGPNCEGRQKLWKLEGIKKFMINTWEMKLILTRIPYGF